MSKWVKLFVDIVGSITLTLAIIFGAISGYVANKKLDRLEQFIITRECKSEQ